MAQRPAFTLDEVLELCKKEWQRGVVDGLSMALGVVNDEDVEERILDVIEIFERRLPEEDAVDA